MRERLKEGIFSSCSLHILAMALMLGDHMWATIFPYMEWLTCIGRIAFPIFAFMIVEGYFHTRNLKKYFLRMLVFALLAEIPFDLVYGSTIFYPFHQNVIWTFLISMGLIWLLEKAKKPYEKERKWYFLLMYIGVSILVCLVGFLVGMISMVDYYGAGVLMVLAFYFLRKRNLLNLILQGLFIYFVFVETIGGYYYNVSLFGHTFELQQEAFSLLALIPIWLYRGRQGYHAKWFQYFCYGFYPGHLLILYLVWQLLLTLGMQ